MPTFIELSASAASTFKSWTLTLPSSPPPMTYVKAIQALNEDVKADKKSVEGKRKLVMERLNQGKYLTQGYPLFDKDAYSKARKVLAEKVASFNLQRGRMSEEEWIKAFGAQEVTDMKADMEILRLLNSDNDLLALLPDGSQERYRSGKETFVDKRFKSQAAYKRKVLFLKFEQMKVAQAQLKMLCEQIAGVFGGELSCPPGAFNGLKSFSGALEKMTKRERNSDFGDLKDVARMTIKFDDEAAMDLARNYIEGSKEFYMLKGYAKSLKNRFGTSSGGSKDDVHNSGALKSGYQDIKFFLKMDNNIIGELQLNTKTMLEAKHTEHYIYDITREAKKQEDGSKIMTNVRVMKAKVSQLTDKWFQDEILSKTTGLQTDVRLMKAMMARMAKTVGPGGSNSLRISKEELKSMNIISTQLFAQVGKGMRVKAV
jgi:hypothetical protein